MNKKTMVVLSVIFSLFILPLGAQAHPPKDVQVSYDIPAKTLTVTITHSTMSAAMHYIKRVDIKKNGKDVESFYYKFQPEKATFSYSYPLPSVEGDIIEAAATCNLYGGKGAKITIGKAAASPGK